MVNDVTIITGFITTFVLLGILLPFVNNAFDNTQTTIDADALQQQFGDDVEDVQSINIFTVLGSVLSMFFWTFGRLPFWLDAVFIIFRVIFIFVVARNTWIGGGG